MYFVDSKNELSEYFLDPKRRIPSAHLKSVCKIRQKGACRYISGIPIEGGFYICTKKTPAKEKIDLWSQSENFSAKADNCEGLGDKI
jgi:hypothetical protein